jgi:hypothetical protein
MNVFKDQSYLTIIATTHQDLSAATVKKILYKKPDGTSGSWTATAVGTNLTYDVQASDIDQYGKWYFQSYIEVGGKKGFGDIECKEFLNHLATS